MPDIKLLYWVVNPTKPSPSPVQSIAVCLILAFMRLASWLPLSVNREIGATLGRIAWLTGGSLKQITLTNLALCYPNLSDDERNTMGRTSLLHTGRSLTESAWVWLRSPADLAKRTRIIAGQSLLADAEASSQGVLFATPHIGNWEACNLILTQNQPITYLYRPPRIDWLEPLMIRWRSNFDAHPARLDPGGLRTILSNLKKGQMVGVLPDQEPDLTGGVFAPLFGEPANSMTLLQKLGTRGEAKVLFCVCQREPGRWFKQKPGWAFSVIEPEARILDADPIIATTAMNKTIERCIALAPEQYLWSYKRFNLLQAGGRRNYKSANK